MTRTLALAAVLAAFALSACSSMGMGMGKNMNEHPPMGQNSAQEQHYPQGQ